MKFDTLSMVMSLVFGVGMLIGALYLYLVKQELLMHATFIFAVAVMSLISAYLFTVKKVRYAYGMFYVGLSLLFAGLAWTWMYDM